MVNISDRRYSGTTKRLPLSKRPFEIDNSCLTGIKGFSGQISVAIHFDSKTLVDSRHYHYLEPLEFPGIFWSVASRVAQAYLYKRLLHLVVSVSPMTHVLVVFWTDEISDAVKRQVFT